MTDIADVVVDTSRPQAPFEDLRQVLDGDLAMPGEPGYDAATPWNRAVSSAPVAVVAAGSGRDVARSVQFARTHGLRVAVRRTGHGATPLGDDVLLVHTAGLSGCVVDAERRSARVAAGATWQDVIDAAAPHGLAPLCGAAPGIGAVGYLTGGGLGPLARTYGVSSDHVRGFEVVTGDGTLRHVGPDDHGDLFWGLRGGKATLGVVTSVDIDLLPLPTLYGGALWFDGAHATEVVEAWLRLCERLPELGTTSVAFVQLPPLPQVPPPLAGRLTVAVRFAWTGSPEAGAAQLAELRRCAGLLIDGVAVMPYTAIGSIHADPTDPMPVSENMALLRELPWPAVRTIIEAATQDNPQTVIELRQLGGAIARDPQHPSAFSHRHAAFTVFTAGLAIPETSEQVTRHSARLIADLAPWTDPGLYANFGVGDDSSRIDRCYDSGTLRRLGELGDEYDPDGVLRTGQVARR